MSGKPTASNIWRVLSRSSRLTRCNPLVGSEVMLTLGLGTTTMTNMMPHPMMAVIVGPMTTAALVAGDGAEFLRRNVRNRAITLETAEQSMSLQTGVVSQARLLFLDHTRQVVVDSQCTTSVQVPDLKDPAVPPAPAALLVSPVLLAPLVQPGLGHLALPVRLGQAASQDRQVLTVPMDCLALPVLAAL